MKGKEELYKEVLQKVENEYSEFIKELKQCKPEVLIERAYEKVVKEELKYGFENRKLSIIESKALLKNDNILQDCYNDWIHADGNFDEVLCYCADNTINNIVKNYEKEINKKNKESR